jgi:hypothetical protein
VGAENPVTSCDLRILKDQAAEPVRALPTQRSVIAFARGARTGVLMIRTPTAANTASNASVNWRPGPGSGT